MRDNVPEFTKAGGLILDACAETFFVTEPCVPLPTLRSFIGFEADPSYVAEAMSQPVLLYAN